MESAAQMGGLLELQNAMRRHSPEQVVNPKQSEAHGSARLRVWLLAAEPPACSTLHSQSADQFARPLNVFQSQIAPQEGLELTWDVCYDCYGLDIGASTHALSCLGCGPSPQAIFVHKTPALSTLP